jgi:ribonuclease BN (tRNA processing enzyme)
VNIFKFLGLAALLLSSASHADSGQPNVFITLGTAGGPLTEPNRSQPAHALIVGDDLYLVDAGDGAAGQLAKAGFRLPQVKGLFISHNHFDHTGGVLAVLGLRMQLNAGENLEIYGPPGTKALIDGLLLGMEPSRKAAYGMPGASWHANIDVIELIDGSIVELDGLRVRVAENSHFRIPENSQMPEKAKSLSFRFDLDDRSIVYTGDTGPSSAVESLASGTDVLVSEMMDIPAVLETIKKISPGMPEDQLETIEWHFRAHHLTPEQVGQLAADADVGTLVVTHMAPNVRNNEMAERYRAEIGKVYNGRIVIANDLDRF